MGNRISNLPAFRAFRFAVTAAGTPEALTVKIRAATLGFTNGGAGNDTITDSGSGFLAAGFKVGDQITVSGATNSGNNRSYTIVAIAAGTLTLNTVGVVTTEVAGATVKIVAPVEIPEGVSITIKARRANTNDIYLGHNTSSADQDTESGSVAGGFILDSNESVELQVNRTDSIWLDADTNGEGVEVLFETNLRAGE
jgi:hypothetical protein